MMLTALFLVAGLALTWCLVAFVIKFITLFLGVAFSVGFATFIWFIVMVTIFVITIGNDEEQDTYDPKE